MSDQDQKRQPAEAPVTEAGSEGTADESRRALLRHVGMAAAVAPAMVVLLHGKSSATPQCDNPAWQLGLKRAGHSGC